ncbi:MAG: biopolymer transporter ExbD [Bacteroidota bacterium]|nr:biopolymer transporter ExbD [Bacteroidota bacterium]
MPKVKIPRKSTVQDMAPMCDMAFLLLNFFILTSNFTQKEPAIIDTPKSISEIKIPETNVMKILVDSKGKVFWGIDKQADRIEVLRKMGEIYNISFTDEEYKRFSVVGSFGVPMSAMKTFLAMSPEQRDSKESALGIPCDSLDNQLKDWVSAARSVNKELRIAIKGDKSTTYPAIKKVMGTLQDVNENRFNLITGLEAEQELIPTKK